MKPYPHQSSAASIRWLILGALLLALPAAAQDIPQAIPTPDGDTSFVGQVLVSFSPITSGNGRIYYTLNGPSPTQTNGTLYEVPFAIKSTTTLRSIRVRSGPTRACSATVPAYAIEIFEPVSLFQAASAFVVIVPSSATMPAWPALVLCQLTVPPF